MQAVYILPMPPSVNNLFPGKKVRYKSPEYKAWLEEAGLRMNSQKLIPIMGPVEVEYAFARFDDRRRRDLMNREKALSDFLVERRAIEDDCFIQKATIWWSNLTKKGMVEVLIKGVL